MNSSIHAYLHLHLLLFSSSIRRTVYMHGIDPGPNARSSSQYGIIDRTLEKSPSTLMLSWQPAACSIGISSRVRKSFTRPNYSHFSLLLLYWGTYTIQSQSQSQSHNAPKRSQSGTKKRRNPIDWLKSNKSLYECMSVFWGWRRGRGRKVEK